LDIWHILRCASACCKLNRLRHRGFGISIRQPICLSGALSTDLSLDLPIFFFFSPVGSILSLFSRVHLYIPHSMDPSRTGLAYARKRLREPALSSAPTQSRMHHKSGSRGKHRSTHILGSQAIQPSSRRGYQQPFNRVPQGRQVPVRDRYDRQPRFVGTPEVVEDDGMPYSDEEFVLFLLSLTYPVSSLLFLLLSLRHFVTFPLRLSHIFIGSLLFTFSPPNFLTFSLSHFLTSSLFTPTSPPVLADCGFLSDFIMPFPIPSHLR
jgi:hypothetical protein